MRTLVMLLFLALATTAAHAAIYEWTDDSGVVNFTDNQNEIPEKYRGKASKRPDPAPVVVKPGAPQLITPSKQPIAAPKLYCGQNETTWRNRFAGLHRERKSLADALSDLQLQEDVEHVKMVRGITEGKYGSRLVYMDFLKNVAQKEAQLQEIDSQLKKLETEAGRCGVPLEWRK